MSDDLERVLQAVLYLIGSTDDEGPAFVSEEGGGFIWDGESVKKHTLYLLMSDTFAYACADSEELETPEDIIGAAQAYRDYGDVGLTAWVAIRRGVDPIAPLITKAYKKAHAALMDSNKGKP